MIEIRYLQAESGANKFGTCNCCGKSSSEDPLMISIKFSYYGHGTLICLCDDCRKKLIEVLNGEQLPPANCSEFPNNSDTISRQQAIEICNHAIDLLKGQFGAGALVAIKESIEELPPAQPGLGKYEYHYDHTDCIWYRPEARNRCPVTCAQYRDGWNDAMNYIFRDGKGYRPYRRGKQYEE